MPLFNALPGYQNPFLLDDLLPKAKYGPLTRLLKVGAEKILGLKYLAQEYERLETTNSPDGFVRLAFKTLDIDYQVVKGSLLSVPESGATILVANHPFGAVEGMIMVDLLLQRRNDVKIMANSILKRVPELSEMFLGVNPYGNHGAKQQNTGSIREAIRWLKQDGLLVIFPAGDVASINLVSMGIQEGAWDESVAGLARISNADVVPVYFQGRNSKTFYFASLIHPVLKTLMLPRELINKQGQTINLGIGKIISKARLAALNTDTDRTTYLRLRTNLLAMEGPTEEQRLACKANDRSGNENQPVIDPVSVDLLESEIRNLPAIQRLAISGDLQVYYARAQQIPWVLQEIGRLREISFREVGEGTGRQLDIDIHDSFYIHLFVWDTTAQAIVGGYRLGLVDEIIKKYGRSGLYSYTLFKYSQSFLSGLGPAVELGRSFVQPEYQRSFFPLMLLWKGIASFMAQQPRYSVLFGPVSISNDYSSLSQQLLIEFLRRNRFDSRLARLVQARTPWRQEARRFRMARLKTFPDTLEILSDVLAAIEPDEKGVPVLIRQYLKLGGQMLGFNIDDQFSNAVDALIRVDLRETEPRLLAKYMGQSQAQAFLASQPSLQCKSA